MDPYVTEEQQVEAIKQWWKVNGGAVITGVAIGLAAVFGWQYWTAHKAEVAEKASVQYAALTEALKEADSQKIQQQGQVLLENFPASFYAVLGAFKLAKLAVEKENNEGAVQHLQWVVDHADHQAIKDIARLRLARVLLAEGRLADVQAKLEQLRSSSFAGGLQELQGDLYLALNEPAKARAAYQAALAADSGNALLQMKWDDLPSTLASQEQ